MSKKSLKQTNPYLKDPRKRHELFVTFVSSSTAIETPFTTSMLREVHQSSEPDPVSGVICESEEPDQSPP